ncbi:uncharacterized protein LOC132624106 [Lycium barbarum]|uniref:uncharacterized protein LOC132624106 n=1 Tax=Lycium barbarum TaxID=112863 RepID=UPI00293E3B3D|nr:uncharacterized protein LOC132624106 [Lycium barbarum]
MNGQAPPSSIPGFPDVTMSIPIETPTSDPLFPPAFGPHVNISNTSGTSTVRPPNAPLRNNPFFIPTVQTTTIPQPTLVQKSNNEPPSKGHHDQYYSPELTFKVPDSYNPFQQYSSPVEIEKTAKNEGQEEMARKMKRLEQSVRNMQGLGGPKSVSFRDLCMFPNVHLPLGFKTPKFKKYNGHGDPVAHLKKYCNQLRGARSKEELLMAYFGESLVGIASEWFIDQDISNWPTWDDMAGDFVRQFQYNIDIVPDRTSLASMKKNPTESFREYAIKWREQAARVKPPMKESEMIDVFLQAQQPDYFHYLLSTVGKTFAEAIKVGEMVENGIKFGKIVSQVALKATTQAIQNRSGGFGNRKKKEEGSMMASGSSAAQRGTNHQILRGQSNSPQHFYPHQDPHYSIAPPQYTVFNTQAYARPSQRQQWRAPAPQGFRPQQQNFQAPYNTRPKTDYVREQRQRENFTPIGESYTSLLRKLIQLGLIEPIMSYNVNPNARGFDPTVRCEYHSNAQGHSTENCFTLKRAIEKLIDDKAIVIHDEEAPNVTNNPLPAHNNAHVVGMICNDKEYKQTGASSNANLKGSGKLILYVPGATKKKETLVTGPKLYVPSGFPRFGQNQNGLGKMTEPIVIKHTTQLPVTNMKTVPWNYNKTIVTYKGKEIVEEIDETGGLTRSGRCYAPEELRRAKQDRDSQFPVKKPITEEKAEEFMKKMKVQDYSIVDQLRKTPAQISLLSLLIHSKEHCQALIRILNEAHVSDKTTVSHLEKMANRIFEVNRITCTDDELPVEGAGHNKALHLTVKCEEHYVKRVMIDGGSGVDICPLSTLQSLKISTDRIRTNNVCVRAFDGAKRDTVGEIDLTLKIGPVDFGITFQVIDMDTSYNLLLGRPWIHAARAVPSTLHQVVKFEYEKQEIIVHGEDDLSIYRDPSVPCVEAKEGCESLIFQTFEIVAADQFMEGKPILEPRLSSTSVMVATQMLQNGYELGKGLGVSLQGIVDPISPFGNQDTFGLGFRPTNANRKWAKEQKNKVWKLPKPIPHIVKSFTRSRLEEDKDMSVQDDVDEICQGLKEMFYGVNMVHIGEGPSHADVQRIGPEVKLANWEATPLPTKKESCFINSGFNNMTCMRNSRPDLKELSNLETMNQEVDKYDEEEAFEEIKRELDQFENKPKPNLNETEAINLGTSEETRETKISIHAEQKTRDDIIQVLFEYKDVFAWSYDDMPGLSVDLVVHKLPTYPNFPPVQQKQRKFKKEVSDKIKEEIMKQLSANVIRVVRFTTWLANVVPVPKKDGKTRVCVDYRDLNKASPKDNFPLPNIHILVDNCAKHEIQSFVDCYAGHHQILIDEEDAEKTVFTTP